MSMGYKTIEAFKWAYENIEFEYIFRQTQTPISH